MPPTITSQWKLHTKQILVRNINVQLFNEPFKMKITLNMIEKNELHTNEEKKHYIFIVVHKMCAMCCEPSILENKIVQISERTILILE